MKRLHVITVWIAAALLGGCSGESATEGEPRLDLAGSQGDFERSQEEIRDSLTEERREIFDEAMRTLYFNATALKDSGTLPDSEVEAYVMQQMHDRTAEQIVNEALRTFRDFCTDNQLSEEECSASIDAAGLDAWAE